MSNDNYVTFQNRCDVLVCGSTSYAIDVAISAASSGRRTVLAMERTNPFIESIGSLRAYVGDGADLSTSPIVSEILAAADYTSQSNSRTYFNPHQ